MALPPPEPKPEPKSETRPDPGARPRKSALSPALLARVFHQASLVYFNAVAEHLSIREAGRRLNVASSAISRQISQLEDALGLPLFERQGRRLRLAPAGEILYRHTRRLSGPLEAAVQELEMLRGLKTGTVRVAAVESIGISFLPEIIADFGRRYPRLHLDVAVCPSADVIERLIGERCDIGFGFISAPPRQIEVALRRDVRIGVVMRPDHPLAATAAPTLAACVAHPLAVGKPEISIRAVIEPFLRRDSEFLPPLVEVDSIRLLVELALTGAYASIMTPIGAQAALGRGDLIFRPLADPGLPLNRFALLSRSGGTLRFASAVFHEHARQRLAAVELPGSL